MLVVLGWVAGAVGAIMYLPPLDTSGSGGSFGGAVSKSSPAVQTEIRAVRDFAFPLLAQDVVVQHRSGGLSLAAQAATVARAARLDVAGLPGLGKIAGALPVTDALRIFPSSHQNGTTALTYLFFRPSVGPSTTARLSNEYAHRYLNGPGDGLVGVTGAYPAENAQGNAIAGSLPIVELLSVALLIIIVGLTFRSVVAPAITLLAAGTAYEVSTHLLGYASRHMGVTVPAELSPILVVLLLGIVTDYSVFYLSSMRRRLRTGDGGPAAAGGAAREVTPVVLVAGVTVATGTALITTAHLPLFAALGPGLAITVAVAVAVEVTFMPAALRVLGQRVLWPATVATAGHVPPSRRARLLGRLRHRWVSAIVVVIGGGALLGASWPLLNTGLGLNLINDLPSSSATFKASRAASAGFSAGIVAPTEILIELAGRPGRPPQQQLAHLQDLISHQRGVAGVLGPADSIPGLPPTGAFVSTDGTQARFLVVLSHTPLGVAGVSDLTGLQAAMPGLLRSSDLTATAHYAGDTAITASITRPARRDLVRVGLLVALATLVMMVIYLRSLIAPLVLTATSVLTVGAALGITAVVLPGPRSGYGFTFYVPFAAEVLLLAFGADYNLFLTGEIWRSARTRYFADAVTTGADRATKAINIAGVTLAASFLVLAVVPLAAFRQLAVAMGAGLLIDTFVVRLLVVPAALEVLGRWARWPYMHRRRTPSPSPTTTDRPTSHQGAHRQ
jgi:RND superfamily putative drug exporter